MLKLTVLGLSPLTSPSDSVRAAGRGRSRPYGATPPTSPGCPASGRQVHPGRRSGAWTARAAAPALAVAVLALWPATASAQTSLTISDASASEGDSMTFTVTLSGSNASEPFKVTPTFTDGTATKGTDYTANTAAIDFQGDSGEEHTFTVATTEDDVVEAGETFTVGLTISETAEERQLQQRTGTATGTIFNDDTATVTIADASANEGGEMTFTMTLDKAVSEPVRVTLLFTDGTASQPGDYSFPHAVTLIRTFDGTANETETFGVQTKEDSIVEGDETFTVSMITTVANVTSTDTATGTIVDDDTATLTIADASADEGDGITFTVTLDKAVPSGQFYVDPSFTDGTATKGTDYTVYQESLDFAGTAGEKRTFTVATTEDAAVEPDETFTVGLSVSGNPKTITATDTATGTILDDDTPTLTIADASADEGDGITFTVTLDKAVSGGLTVTPSFTGGTAKKGTDYTATAAGISFTGTAGEEQTFTVETLEDWLVEPDETFTVSLSVSGTTKTITATDTATGTIRDDDTALTLTIEDASATEGDLMTFEVTLKETFPIDRRLYVQLHLDDGTAKREEDFNYLWSVPSSGLSGNAEFAGNAGETVTWTMPTIEDDRPEPDETFTVRLVPLNEHLVTFTTNTATGTIIDDDPAPADVDDDDASTSDDGDAPEGDDDDDAPEGDDDGAPTVNLSVNPSSVGEGASGTTVTVTAALSAGKTLPSNRTVTVSVGGGTATSGTDYAAVSTFAITIPAGASHGTGTFTLRPIQDTAVEGNETIGVAGRAGNLTVNGTALTLTDDDSAPEVNLSVDPSSVSEGDESTTVTVTAVFSNGSTFSRDTTVRVSVGGGTARAGTDYAAVSGFDVRIRKGETSGTATFTLTPTADARVEAAETIRVTGRASGLEVNGTRLTLADSTPRLGVRAARAVEGEAMVFTVTLQTAGSQAVTVQYATVDGTATAGADYTATSGQLVFSADETEHRISVPIADDTEVEDNETFALETQLVDVAGPSASATGTIIENDVLTVSFTAPDVRETDGLATFTGSLSSASSYRIVVEYGTSDGTATAGADYLETTGELVFAPGETEKSVAVQVLDDDLVEGAETLLLSMTVVPRDFGSPVGQTPPIRLAGSGATGGGSPASLQITGTIRDDDLARTRGAGTSRTLYLLARSMASEAVAAIGERFVAPGGDDADTPRATLGAGPPAPGQGVAPAGAGMAHSVAVSSTGGGSASPWLGRGAAGSQRPSDEPFADLGWLDNASFSVPVGQADRFGRWQVWGRAGTVRSRLQTPTGGHARGDVFSSHVGVDRRLGDSALLGVSLSHTVGLLGYTVGSSLAEGASPGEGDGRVTSVQPYAHWAPRDGLTLWGMGGGGLGSLTLADSTGMVETPLGLRLFAGGARQALTAGLALKADAFHATLRSAEHDDLAAAIGTAMRGRVLAEGQSDWALSESSSLVPRLEAGLRWDGGTDVEGLGAEIGVGLAYVNRRLNLGLETQGRYLVAHQAAGFEEWGAGLSLRVGPGVDRPGPWLALNPEWGAPDSRVNALWDPRAAPELHRGAGAAPGARPDRIGATAGYRLSEANSVSLGVLHETRGGAGRGVAARVTGNLNWGGGSSSELRAPADSRFRRGENAAGDAPHAGRQVPVRLDAVAVAAFHNLSGTATDHWIVAGVTETLTNAFEQLDAISIVDHGEAGAAAPAWLVTGEYQRWGNRLQIDARVVDTRSGTVAAQSRAEGGAGELFDLQDRIVAHLSRELRNLSAGGRPAGRERAARELPRRRGDERRPAGGGAASAPQRALARIPLGIRTAGLVEARPATRVRLAAVAARPSAPARLDTVAIDPFHNLSRAPADDWLGAGVTETLSAAFEQLDAVDVVGNTGDAGPEAAWLVTGEYRRRGDRLQIDAAVVDTRTGAVAARSRAEGATAEFFDLQDRITADLAGVLENLCAGRGTGFAN